MAIEDVLPSKGRVKILKILAEIGELNTSAIARRAGLNYATTIRHLQALEKAGLLRHKSFGRIRIFCFDERNPRARIVKELIDLWDKGV